jgi:teichuronic acid exporter
MFKREVRKLEKVTKSRIIYSFFWKFLEKGGTQFIQLISQIILARILLPEDFGTIAIITIFINVSNVFIQAGFNTALIQKKDADETDFSTVFYFSLFTAGVLYTLIYFISPIIGAFYSLPILTPILNVMSLTLFFGVVTSIQFAYVSRKMEFKKYFKGSLLGIIISVVIAISLAILDYGIWSLVASQLFNNFFKMISLWIIVPWRPKLEFSFSRVKKLFSYGWNLLLSNLLDTAYLSVYGLVIGRIYNAEILGYYNKGDLFPKIIVTNLKSSIANVMFPVMSLNQDNKPKVKQMVRRTISTSSFIVFPVMIGLSVSAHSVVEIVLTEKWLPSVPFLQLLCLSYALYPLHTANLQAISALGRSDIVLKLEIIKKCVGILVLLVSIPMGLKVMVGLQIITSIISAFINAFPNRSLLSYTYKEQWEDIMPSIAISLIMGTIVYFINWFNISEWVKLTLQISLGLLVYLGLAKILKIEVFKYLEITLSDLIRKKEKGASQVG